MAPIVCFWLFASCVLYAYLIYPLLMFVAAKLRPWPTHRMGLRPQSFSIVLAAHNEEANIARRVRELTELIAACGLPGELIVVSDGSTDRTPTIARRAGGDRVRVIEMPSNVGKAAALNKGCAAARHQIIIFADARQHFAPDALTRLLDNFIDPTVGAVSGDLILKSSSQALAGVGLYWRYEKWLRKHESRFHSIVGVTGAISALRRSLYRPIPRGTVLDDVYWPLQVAMQGFRIVHEDRAHAFDHLPHRPRDEFRRKVRTLSNNFQLLTRLPAALVPWHNPVWFEFVSHKLCRLLVPWALLGTLLCSATIHRPLYQAAFALQCLLFLIALAGLDSRVASRARLASAAASFLMLNAAAWFGFWIWLFGKSADSWRKVSYQLPTLRYSQTDLRSI
ncbi:MAG: glycosyltransferase family 2 protein [Bacillota bacterium]